METAPVGTAIIRLALPMIAAMPAQAIYNMTDMFFIGQTGDPNMAASRLFTACAASSRKRPCFP
jgi:Na+-driven multidrug efflux pump